VGAGPTELKVDAVSMGAARATTWRQRGPMRRLRSGRSPRCLTGGGAVEEKNSPGGVEGVEVGAGPAELEVDAAGAADVRRCRGGGAARRRRCPMLPG
jgi:hypothetical protein